MNYLSFIPWIFYLLLTIKYNKKKYYFVNYKLIIVTILYIYLSWARNQEVLFYLFSVGGIFLFINAYYDIPKSDENKKNNYTKYLYIIPFIPIIIYAIFHKLHLVYIIYIILCYAVDLFLYLYHKKR